MDMDFLEYASCPMNLSRYLKAFKNSSESIQGFPGSSAGKESACNAGDHSLIPGSERFPGGGHGNPLQYSCLGNSTDRTAWQATVHGGRRVRHD